MATYLSAAPAFTFQGQLSYTYISLQTERARCGGEHTTSTPPPPLQILSGFRKLRIDNNNNKKLHLNIYTATEEDYTFPRGFLGIRESKAVRLCAPTVPNQWWQRSHSKRIWDYRVPLFIGHQGLGNSRLN